MSLVGIKKNLRSAAQRFLRSRGLSHHYHPRHVATPPWVYSIIKLAYDHTICNPVQPLAAFVYNPVRSLFGPDVGPPYWRAAY